MNEAKKFDGGKLQYHLIPQQSLAYVVRVLMFGARKYGEHNWLDGMKWSRLTDAAERHLKAFMTGSDLDKETKLPHLAHAICCLLFLLTYSIRGIGEDDRTIEYVSFEEKQIEE